MKTERVCASGHKYHKSSDCPVCPICEQKKKSTSNFILNLSAPAKKALENEGITTLKKLSSYSESEILKLHGIGPTAIPKLKLELQKEGLSFRKK